MAPFVAIPVEKKYAPLRQAVEVARKDLRDGGWARLYSALISIPQLGVMGEELALRDWGNICKVIFGRPKEEVFALLEAHKTAEQLAAIGFDEKLLRGSEEAIESKLNLSDPRAFNQAEAKKLINSYLHFKMWKRANSI